MLCDIWSSQINDNERLNPTSIVAHYIPHQLYFGAQVTQRRILKYFCGHVLLNQWGGEVHSIVLIFMDEGI